MRTFLSLSLPRAALFTATLCAGSAIAQYQERTPPDAIPGDGGRDVRAAGDAGGNWVVVYSTDSDPVDDVSFADDFEAVAFSRSSDNGVTWSDPAPIDAGALTDNVDEILPEIATDGAGTWIVAWSRYVRPLPGSDRGNWVARSTDNGATWSAPVLVANSTGSLPTDFHAITTDSAGNWIVMWTERNDGDIAYVQSSDNGLTWTSKALITYPSGSRDARVATDSAGRWIAAWAHVSGSTTQVLRSISIDNGNTWSPPATVSTLPGAEVSVTYGGNDSWVILFEENTPLGSPHGIKVLRSTDDGATWAQAVPLPCPSCLPDHRLSPRLTTDVAGNWIAAWKHNFVARSSDLGASWTPTVQIQQDSGNHYSIPAVATDGAGNGIMFWQENVPGQNPYRVLYTRWTGILAPDRDGDNLSDADEIVAGTNIDTWDTDGDALSDADELGNGTNPLTADTDGDGVWDSIEIALGTDPNDPFDFPLLPVEWAWVAVALAAVFGVALIRRRPENGAL